jgi:hypothetical protein
MGSFKEWRPRLDNLVTYHIDEFIFALREYNLLVGCSSYASGC